MQGVEGADRLVLGTAQLGLDYGVSNSLGKPVEHDAVRLLDTVWDAGVRWFDTAPAYGDSEAVLGKYLAGKEDGYQARVITKLSPNTGAGDQATLSKDIHASLQFLNCGRFAGLMLHRESLLDEWDTVRAELDPLLNAGLFEKIGVSVYTPESAIKALGTDGIGMVQIPANLLDHRFRQQNVFDIAEAANKEIFIRSVYLQGLFFAKAKDFSHRKDRLRYLDRERALFWIDQVNSLAADMGISVDSLALAYIRDAYPRARVDRKSVV